MGMFFGFIVFCCCAWWWIRGSAFVAFALSAVCVLLALSGHRVPHEMKADEDFAALIALSCGPWVIRSYLLPRRKQVDLRPIARPQSYGAGNPRITGERI